MGNITPFGPLSYYYNTGAKHTCKWLRFHNELGGFNPLAVYGLGLRPFMGLQMCVWSQSETSDYIVYQKTTACPRIISIAQYYATTLPERCQHVLEAKS